MAAKEDFKFIHKGLSVYAQDQEGVVIEAVVMPPETVEDKTDFKVIRPLGNIALFPKEDLNQNKYTNPKKDFNPPIEFQVYFDDEILNAPEVEGDFSKLKLAYWNHNDGRWERLDIDDEDHEYKRVEEYVVEVKLKRWIGDPTLAWGR